MTPVPPAVVFTDLDGTLLGHHDYSVDGALPGLERCAALGVPVIPTTSKTAAETEALEDSLGAAAGMAASFDGELRRMRESFATAGKDAATLERGLSK